MASSFVHRTCSLCEAHCGVSVEVEAGRVRSVRGDPDDAFSRGYICPKAHGLLGLQEDPDRLRRPLRRTAAGWQELSWDAALDEAAERLAALQRAHGRHAVAFYQGNPTVHNHGAILFGHLFQRSLRSRSRYSATSVDQLPQMLAAAALLTCVIGFAAALLSGVVAAAPGPAADAARQHRQPVDDDQPLRKAEKFGAQLVSASLDHFRALRDAATEAQFFSVYANLFALYNDEASAPARTTPMVESRELPETQAALASMHEGGYTEALARVAFLLTRSDEPLPLSRLEMRHELLADYADFLPDMPLHDWRRVRGTQEIIVRHEPEQAVATLPDLLGEPNARARLLTLLDKLMADKRVIGRAPTAAQTAMVARIRTVLGQKAPRKRPTLVRARA